MNLSYTLNSTTTPSNYMGNDTGVRNYINSSCFGEPYCLVPITYIVGSGGILQISNMNLTRNINPVSLDTSLIQDLNTITLSPTYTGGTVTFNDIRFDFIGSKNITAIGHDGDYSTSINQTIKAVASIFNISFPSGVEYWELFPKARNQSNIEPYGQNSTHGIWNVNNLGYGGNIDVYARYNESVDSCVTNMNLRGQNFSKSALTNISTLNITNLTISPQKIIDNQSSSQVGNIRTYTTINCSGYSGGFIIPYFCFFSICSDCVKTQDYDSLCEWYE
jgi:hypothetical protein